MNTHQICNRGLKQQLLLVHLPVNCVGRINKGKGAPKRKRMCDMPITVKSAQSSFTAFFHSFFT